MRHLIRYSMCRNEEGEKTRYAFFSLHPKTFQPEHKISPEFYSEQELREWEKSNPINPEPTNPT